MENTSVPVIAIDGPSASGKGTVAQIVAVLPPGRIDEDHFDEAATRALEFGVESGRGLSGSGQAATLRK